MISQLPVFQPPVKPYNFSLLRLLNLWFKPTFIGAEHIEKTPSMFVGNHTLYGFSDVPLMQAKLYNEQDIYIRPIVDKLHYKIPIWPKYLESMMGTFRGTRALCSAAMENKDHLLLFPGGAREIHKRRGEQYKLIWKNRLGFVKMCAKHSYPIQPFASVGAEDAWSVLIDASDWQKSLLRPLLEQIGPLWNTVLKKGEEIPTLARGIGITNIPRPEPYYFAFAPAIETADYKDLVDDDGAMMELRDQVKTAVEGLIEQARTVQSENSSSGMTGLWRNILRKM